MAVTGLLMVLFVVGHFLGNSTVFVGPNALNTYADKLHALAPVVWGTRVVMLVAVVLHLVISIKITMENEEANPTQYAVTRLLRATFAGRTMIYTGLALGAFILYHLLDFTFRVTPGLVLGTDSLNRFDVYTMVYESFRNVGHALLYIVAMVALFLHLSHGIQSTFQSLGLNNTTTLPRFVILGRALSFVFLIGYGLIPVAILFGWLAK